MKQALITGITGQDGSYLAELLIEKGYRVYGLVRPNTSSQRSNLAGILGHANLHFINGDINDAESLHSAIETSHPDEVYNLAAQTFVGTSWEQPQATLDTTGTSVCKLLSAIKRVMGPRHTKFYQASSSEMFGNSGRGMQGTDTPFNPCSPYGVAKVAAHHTAMNFRDSYGMFVCCGILFNHESPRRGEQFVTQKIATHLARVSTGKQDHISLGSLHPRRDWGYAKEYVVAMWKMLQQDEPRNFVIGTGEATSVAVFVDYCLRYFHLKSEGTVRHDHALVRPLELNSLTAETEEAEVHLGWKAKYKAEELAYLMCEAAAKREGNCDLSCKTL